MWKFSDFHAIQKLPFEKIQGESLEMSKWPFYMISRKIRLAGKFHILRKFTITLFNRYFVNSTSLTKEVTKELISRNIFSVRVKFSFFHTVHIFLRPYFQ